MRSVTKVTPWIVCAGLILTQAACAFLGGYRLGDREPALGSPADAPGTGEGAAIMVFELNSHAFDEGAAIPRQYTCQGEDTSPELAWTGAPAGTQSFALIMDDPDAPGVWVHWVVYNLPASQAGLPATVAAGADLGGAMQGRNSWRTAQYGGPCPPSGSHRYFFTLYALDTMLPLAEGATKADVLAAMQGHILAEAQLMGTYQKS